MKPLFFTLPFCLALISLSACSGRSDKPAPSAQERPVDVLYLEAADALDAGDYQTATRQFEEVERIYPYSRWATQAQLMAAYASYRDARYNEAILALDRFIELHPGNPNVDYAYYLKALSYYEQISDVTRDQSITKQAMDSFETLMRRFPDSRFARDVSLKLDLVHDHLAGKEMEIGRYYLERNQMNAALNRFKRVIRDYQTTSHVPEALNRMVEIYLTLGLKGEATRVAAVLGHNYPGSEWYEHSYALLDPKERAAMDKSESWVDRTLESLLR